MGHFGKGSYLFFKCHWSLVVAEVSYNISFLPENAGKLYVEETRTKNLRMSDQHRRFMRREEESNVKFDNPELRSPL